MGPNLASDIYILIYVFLLLPSGCASPPPRPELLISPREVGRDFLMRQKIEATFEDQTHAFEAALQKQGDTLTVIGFTPMGTRAFVVIQEGLRVELTSHMPPDRPLPLDPHFLLADIHHAFLLPAGVTDLGGVETVQAEVDLRRGLVKRTFRRLNGSPPGEVVVTYEGGLKNGVPPRITRLDNGYYDYGLTIETLTHQWLDDE